MTGGVAVDPHGCGARAVERPRRHTRDDAADDRTKATDVLIALSVTEHRAPGLAVVAVTERATATGARTRATAETAAATTASVARRVAVHVVAGPTAAETAAVDLPPSAEQGARRALVLAAEGATELGVAVAAELTAVAGRSAATADRCVGRGRLQRVGDRVDRDRADRPPPIAPRNPRRPVRRANSPEIRSTMRAVGAAPVVTLWSASLVFIGILGCRRWGRSAFAVRARRRRAHRAARSRRRSRTTRRAD